MLRIGNNDTELLCGILREDQICVSTYAMSNKGAPRVRSAKKLEELGIIKKSWQATLDLPKVGKVFQSYFTLGEGITKEFIIELMG